MHILFVATVAPENAYWRPFLENVSSIEQYEGVVRLAENVWLLDLMKSIKAFGLLAHQAESQKVSYGLLAFADAPQWLPASYNPKTTPDRSVRAY